MPSQLPYLFAMAATNTWLTAPELGRRNFANNGAVFLKTVKVERKHIDGPLV